MSEQFSTLSAFMEGVSAGAPAGMKTAWFINEWFMTKDLQDGLLWSATRMVDTTPRKFYPSEKVI